MQKDQLRAIRKMMFAPKPAKRVGKVVRVSTTIKVEPVSAGSTVGKMKLFRKIVKAEVADFADIIGVGRFSDNTAISVKTRYSL